MECIRVRVNAAVVFISLSTALFQLSSLAAELNEKQGVRVAQLLDHVMVFDLSNIRKGELIQDLNLIPSETDNDPKCYRMRDTPSTHALRGEVKICFKGEKVSDVYLTPANPSVFFQYLMTRAGIVNDGSVLVNTASNAIAYVFNASMANPVIRWTDASIRSTLSRTYGRRIFGAGLPSFPVRLLNEFISYGSMNHVRESLKANGATILNVQNEASILRPVTGSQNIVVGKIGVREIKHIGESCKAVFLFSNDRLMEIDLFPVNFEKYVKSAISRPGVLSIPYREGVYFFDDAYFQVDRKQKRVRWVDSILVGEDDRLDPPILTRPGLAA